MMKQKYTSELSRGGFTLIEMMIATLLLVLIFTFLYTQFNLAQLSTDKTTQVELTTDKRKRIIMLLYNDFLTSSNLQSTSGLKFDRFVNAFSTSNSLHGIYEPHVKYIVVQSNDIKTLLRLESHADSIDISSAKSLFYMDKVLEDIEYFKVMTDNREYIEFYLSAKGMKDIYFKFNKVQD